MKWVLFLLSFYFLIPALASCKVIKESIPLTIIKNYLFVPVRINNSQPLYFLLDSGAGGTVMDDSTAKAIGLQPENETFNTGANGSTRTWSCNDNLMRLGSSVTIKKITISALPLSSMSAVFGIPVAGITGYDIFSRYISETNIDSQQLYLWEQQAFPKKEGESIDFTISDNHLIYFTGEYIFRNQKKLKLKTVIDSGSGRFLSLYSDAVQKYGLLQEDRTYNTVQERGTENIMMTSYIDTLPGFRMGGLTHNDVRLVLAANAPNTVSTTSHPIEALIGQGLLIQYNITYDYFRKKMYLQKRKRM